MMLQSEREARADRIWGLSSIDRYREHRYIGGPPPPRIKKMQIAHETRARKTGVPWDMVDLRLVYRRDEGICGICRMPVSLETFTIDHIYPISAGGPHVLHNLQIAHRSCNSIKGDRLPERGHG